jgi:hypothetical protein
MKSFCCCYCCNILFSVQSGMVVFFTIILKSQIFFYFSCCAAARLHYGQRARSPSSEQIERYSEESAAAGKRERERAAPFCALHLMVSENITVMATLTHSFSPVLRAIKPRQKRMEKSHPRFSTPHPHFFLAPAAPFIGRMQISPARIALRAGIK